ncbi:MAG: cupin domain-containing protein [Gaiellaceae bacterium]
MNLLLETGRVGGEEWGCTVYELAPGQASPYHWHVGEEEWLLVLSGAPTLRTPAGERELRAWDVTVFPRGEAGAHQLRNDTDEPVRAAFFSTKSDPEVAVYPDEGKIGVVAGDIRGWVVEP